MSFAAHRTTSREEDIAYCLLGLSDVNMPPLYGEGASNAFQRLQIEIIRKSSDESLFAWRSNVPASGMLASSTSCFADMGNITKTNTYSRGSEILRRRFAMSNIGLELPVPRDLPENGLIPVYLNCCRDQVWKALCIQLQVQDEIAFRVRCEFINPADFPQSYGQCDIGVLTTKMKNTRTIHVKQPDVIELEYSRIMSQIEGNELLFTKLSVIVTAGPKEGPFLNPGPGTIPTNSDPRFMEPGDGPPEVEAIARGNTCNALMFTAADVVFSGESRSKILCQDREWGVSDMSVPLINLVEALDADSDIASFNRIPPQSQ
ncbi:MAG: hypothetical protein L6R40_006114 [Gallowayella cf. fulva]|nr:MAG: hypothetical protein L6R40_006114 [Xanthomendoza cf. fulva]